MATPNLNLDHIVGSQNNKETTANAAFDGLDNAMNSLLQKSAAAGDVLLTAAEFRGCQLIRVYGTLGAGFTLSLPASIKKLFSVFNATGQAMTIECASAASTGVSLAANSAGIFYTDGDEITTLGAQSTSGSGVSISTVTASRNLTDADLAGNVILNYTGASNGTISIESGLTGTEPVTLLQNSDKTVTFHEGSGVALISAGGLLTTNGLGSAVQIIPLGSDTYFLIGNLA